MSDIEVFQAPGVSLAFRYTPDELAIAMQQLLEMRRAVLIEGTDYGLIPGTGSKPALLKSGAEKLVMVAGFMVHDDSLPPDPGRDGVTIRYTLLRAGNGPWVCGLCGEHYPGYPIAQAKGYAGYDEDRFYKSPAMQAAGAERVERKYAAKDNREVNPRRWEGPFDEYRAPWNSVLKMAAKRAFVAATLNAVAGSGLFTQDIDDQADPVAPATAAQGAAETYDPMAHLSPWLEKLTTESRDELRIWREREGFPAPRLMTQEHVERVLVFIGILMAGQPAPGTPATAPAQAETASTPAPPAEQAETSVEVPETQQAPDLLGALEASLAAAGLTGSEEDPERPFDDGNATSGSETSESIPPTSEMSWGERNFEEQTDPSRARARAAEAAPEQDLQARARAVHLHRIAGVAGMKKADQEAVIAVASEGRTSHAGELTEGEMEFAELLVNQVKDGTQKIQTILEAAAEMGIASR